MLCCCFMFSSCCWPCSTSSCMSLWRCSSSWWVMDSISWRRITGITKGSLLMWRWTVKDGTYICPSWWRGITNRLTYINLLRTHVPFFLWTLIIYLSNKCQNKERGCFFYHFFFIWQLIFFFYSCSQHPMKILMGCIDTFFPSIHLVLLHLSPAVYGINAGTPWIGRQSIPGQHRAIQPCTHIQT